MNVLLTGVSKGLGLIILKELLKNNHKVFGISRTKTVELEKLVEQYSEQFVWIEYDLGNYYDIKSQLFKYFKDKPIHAYINNAAIAYDDLITNLNIDSLLKMYNVNVFTPMLITKYVIRNMLLFSTKGSIVHISSISVHTGYKGLAMYASTKGALEAFSKNTAREWGEKGIRSNCVVVGFMETEMTSALNEEIKNRIYQRTTLKKPVDKLSVAKTVLFLISDEASSITGQNVFVDNGTI
ncbi:MAG: SDR family oxidoreductase [Bacteroidales bacterium]|nr:SDR family oxidoreductase [Bacteroidales bacterium]